MFSGIVADVGTIAERAPEGDGARLVVRTALPLAEVSLGDSIAVDGVCLTVAELRDGAFVAVCGRETLAVTTLGHKVQGDRVHLERALRLGDRLDGHLVSGHVDGVGHVRSARAMAESHVLWIDAPPLLSRYISQKGSIAVDGVSLTVNELEGHAFRVNLIPYTAQHTRLAGLAVGDPVNLEVDRFARMLERLMGLDTARAASE